LNANVNLHQHLEELQNALGNEMQIQYVYENLGQELGYSSKLTPRALEILLQIDSIKYVEEDQIAMHADCKTQYNCLWGLLRSSNRNYTDGYDSQDRYQYDYTTSKTGLGVDAYILDTGIYCEHEEFTKKADGTCSFGYSSVKDGSGNIDESDGNGHGTHVAGTVGGIDYGVAKECNLIAVKVLDDNGYGPFSGVISGIDW
jgi:subtilisin family serine protease